MTAFNYILPSIIQANHACELWSVNGSVRKVNFSYSRLLDKAQTEGKNPYILISGCVFSVQYFSMFVFSVLIFAQMEHCCIMVVFGCLFTHCHPVEKEEDIVSCELCLRYTAN